MSSRHSAVIVAARRTPIGTAGRGLRDVPAAALAVAAVRAAVGDLGAMLPAVDDVVLGEARGAGGGLARLVALAAELGHDVPGLTIDRQCASGLAAVATAVDAVRAGSARVVVAGGTESVSLAAPGRARFAPGTDDVEMGAAAELVAQEAGIGRARQDAYAARSHARAAAAAVAGAFAPEIVPVAGVTRDERPRPGLTIDRLARFPAAFVPGGTVTAGNSCGLNDGAAAVVVMDEATARHHQLPGLRVLGVATAALDPRRCGLALVPAAEAALVEAELTVGALDAVEVNEAFAGQVLAALDALGVPEERCCPDGGAIGLGHPWGASGAVLVVRLFSRLVRGPLLAGGRPQGRGLAAIAAGGGQGVALVVEAWDPSA
jgi:acetyl-CoA C-acetyltransferase